ncbi:aldo/keto reductase [Sinomonas sp. JGH33]|uniref:Aldo/keto reductase n=1 Tax=Sinomonas terricola TaxID=3110330 RepID=A0ABU5TA29_9MICC|nr:aldo/keto reductase [Sinomonas sp. JGH33]MEA5456380.1 aldo/keto reductase [Sinomonas sp. JGH33]
MQTTPGISVPTVTLNDGADIPQLGFGVFQVPAEETQRVVEDALAAGYRHIDTAAAYRNEAGVGAAIAASGIPREDLFITTKLRNGEQGRPFEAFEASRAALGLDYLDLYLIHWPVPSQGLFVSAWRAMEELQANQVARSIGVSNFLSEHLDALAASARVVPAVNQIELHPTFQQRELAARSRSRGIAVEAYSPLGQGGDLDAAAVRAVAEAHGATPAQIVLAWHLAQGTIVIPKTTSAQRMRENLAAVAVVLGPDELERISALDSGARIGGDPATAAHTQL